jgi:glutamate-1-semialdehyde 2,1-aminomutase
MAKYRSKSTQRYLTEARAYLASVSTHTGPDQTPVMIQRGRGVRIETRDRTGYTDYALAGGALILGHAHRNVVLGVKKIAERGILLDKTSSDAVHLARHLVRAIPSVDKVAFWPSRARSLEAAVRLARVHQKKSRVITFDLCGYAEEAGMDDAVDVLPYNDADRLWQTVHQHPGQIACIVCEAVTARQGVVPAEQGFIDALRQAQAEDRILIILDEAKTGFRSNPQGAQKDFGIRPDLTCLAGIVGGGFPLAAVGGREAVMASLPLTGRAPDGVLSQDLSPLMMRAGISTLKMLDQAYYRSLNQKSEKWAHKVNTFFRDQKIDAHIARYHSMMSLYFTDAPVRSLAAAAAAVNPDRYARLRDHLLRNGIFFPPSQTDPFFVTLFHKSRDLQELLTSLQKFFTV